MGLSGEQGEMWKDALQCIFDAFVLQIFSIGKVTFTFFAQWSSQSIKILIPKVHLNIFLWKFVFSKHQKDYFACYEIL